MTQIVVYSTHYCPYCMRAKKLLDSKGLSYQEIFVDEDEEQREVMIRLSGRRTVPQILINQQPIGGYDDLVKLVHSGQLNQMLE